VHCHWIPVTGIPQKLNRFPSWPGLSRPSTSYLAETLEDVDARHEAGHDGVEAQRAKAESIHLSSGAMHCFACARNEKFIRQPATKQHDGQITKSLSSPSRKNISVAPSGKSEV
jgi:hypothetical protein